MKKKGAAKRGRSGSVSGVKGLYQRGNVYWFQPAMVGGRRPKPISLGTSDLGEASMILERMRKRGRAEVLQTGHLSYYVAMYLQCREEGQDCERMGPKTLEDARWVLNRMSAEMGDPRVETLHDGVDFREWENNLQADPELSHNSKSSRQSRVRGFVSWLVKNGVLISNPFEGRPMLQPVGTRNAKYVDMELFSRLVKKAEEHGGRSRDFLMAAALARLAGLRYREIDQLRVEDVNLQLSVISIHPPQRARHGQMLKTRSSTREVPLDKSLARILNLEDRKSKEFVIAPKVTELKPKGKFRKDFRKTIIRYRECLETDLDFGFRDLRRSFETDLMRRGHSVATCATVLGHSAKTAINHYLLPDAAQGISLDLMGEGGKGAAGGESEEGGGGWGEF